METVIYEFLNVIDRDLYRQCSAHLMHTIGKLYFRDKCKNKSINLTHRINFDSQFFKLAKKYDIPLNFIKISSI